jgi:LAS superfamily LD-carboxypeptidase LdcB
MAVGALMLGIPATASGQDPDGRTLEDLRREREEVRAREAAQAGTVDALQADDAEARAALAALNADVRAQQDRVEELELETVHRDLRTSAVDAYVSLGAQRPVSGVGVKDVNDAVNKRTLLEFQAGESADLIEDYRSIQDDLAVQRAAAAEAAERSRQQRIEVEARMEELQAALDRQQDFVAQLEQRIDAALAEAQALASIDAELAASIQTKEAELARAIAAQRAADEARAAARAAAGATVLSAPASGGSFVPPTIVGSGEIVSVGGISVHQSIAGQVQAMLSAAAADGIQLSGSGYRDSARQVELRRQHCGSSSFAIYEASPSSCSPPTARPGSSMHERGLAIDFREGGSALTRSSAGFRWLQGNAARFGFFNLPSEPWHWSTTGQ